MNKILLIVSIPAILALTMCSSSDDTSEQPSSSGETSSSSIANSSSSEGTSSSSSVYIAYCNGIEYNPYSQYCSEDNLIDKGEFTDTRPGGQTYKTVQIGGQTWMAENLNYAAAGSKCYGDNPDNCIIYGRLYDWATAMALPSNCNDSECAEQIQTKHKGICPQGWHLPSRDEWIALNSYVESQYGSYTSGKYLKAKSGWNEYEGESGNGTDGYGFAALPGGIFCFDTLYFANGGVCSNKFDKAGIASFWWNSSEYDTNIKSAYYWAMSSNGEAAFIHFIYKSSLISVRCLQD